MDIHIDRSSRIPLNDQIKGLIRDLIHAGRLTRGDKLPTIRELAEQVSVNVNTIALVYRDLTQEGVVITERGKGTFVSGTPDEEEIKTIRQEKLKALIESLICDTDRLGYDLGEVERAFNDQVRPGSQ